MRDDVAAYHANRMHVGKPIRVVDPLLRGFVHQGANRIGHAMGTMPAAAARPDRRHDHHQHRHCEKAWTATTSEPITAAGTASTSRRETPRQKNTSGVAASAATRRPRPSAPSARRGRRQRTAG